MSAQAHLDHPDDFHWFKGEGPRTVMGPCPHTTCRHHAQSVIAWGPDLTRYELVTCDVDEHCAGNCRAWTDGSARSTSPWLQVAALAGSADDTREET
ncbi:hypothetical protein [Pseudonocardia sp.]|uniref:hypothetical protein n=1 Tax=Pseudonocardia sp. TaxID=60912 RepID=UPI003D11D9DE